MAVKAVDVVFRKLGRKPPPSKTEYTPIHGGQIESFNRFLAGARQETSKNLSNEAVQSLVHNHGSRYRDVTRLIDGDPELGEMVGTSHVLKAEVIHAVREEMARKLDDVAMRRTDLGSGGHPGEEPLRICARLMGRELGWDNARIDKEIDEVNARYLGRGGHKSYNALKFG